MPTFNKSILLNKTFRRDRKQEQTDMLNLPLVRTKEPNKQIDKLNVFLLQNPLLIQRELNNRSFFEFFVYFWDVISSETLVCNWHLEYLCGEVQEAVERVSRGEAKLQDILINIPPGTTKTTILSIMLPVWCWTNWYWMRLITASYSASLSLESAETARDIIRSDKFKEIYPELRIKDDKDTKSNYRIEKVTRNEKNEEVVLRGGNRFTTSVGGSLTGYHGHILLVDDPLNPNEAVSKQILYTTNYWVDNVLSTRKVDKDVTLTIVVMQRLHENDPAGHLIRKKGEALKQYCLPGDLLTGLQYLKPKSLVRNYIDGLLDPIRLSRKALNEMEQDLGQYGYAGQVDQNPVPPGGGMFKVDGFQIIDALPHYDLFKAVVRYWDKAGSKDTGAYTVGLKMGRLKDGRYIIIDVIRGQWATHEREAMIKKVAEADDFIRYQASTKIRVSHYIEQEPGSGGKESADATVRNLSGYLIYKDLPRGDKIYRADPFSVQVNNGNVLLLRGEWNQEYINEVSIFPLGKYKDQVDASSGAFSKLSRKKVARAC